MANLNNLKKAILTSVITLFLYTFVDAQCNPDNIIVPGQSCQSAAITCTLDGYCGDLQPGNWGDDAGFCSGGFTLQNPHWFSFVASSNIIDIDIALSGCGGGNATAQWGLFNNCNNLNAAIVCNGNGVPSGGIINVFFNEAVPGATYYLVLDGSSGALCHYEFTKSTGTTGALIGEPIDTVLTGDPYICVDHIQDYSFAGFKNATSYAWLIEDVNLGTNPTPNITFNVPLLQEGTYQLCVQATNECDSLGKTTCWPVILDPNRTIEETLYTCPGDSVLYFGTYYQAGNYLVDYIGFNNCISKVDLTVIEHTIQEDSTLTIYVCPGETSYEVNGNTYLLDSLYENFELVSPDVCFYTGNVIIKQLDTTGYRIIASIDPLPCISGQSSVLSFAGSLIPGVISYGIKWYNDAGQQVESGLHFSAKKPGHYYLILTQFYNNSKILWDTDPRICIIRMDYFIKNSTPITIDPIINQLNSNPGEGKYTLNIINENEFVPGTNFKWIIPNGIGYTILNPTIANLTFSQNGTYTICAYATDGCTVSDTICIEIIASEISATKGYDNFGIELKGNPVTSELIFDVKNMNGKVYDIDILSIYGNLVKSQSLDVENTSIIIDVNQLIPGTYIYHIRTDKGSISTGKFVKL